MYQGDKNEICSCDCTHCKKIAPHRDHDLPSSDPAAEEKKWLIWSFEHAGWWLPASQGYTTELLEAGHYSYDRALELVTAANKYRGHKDPNEAMLPVYWEIEVNMDEALKAIVAILRTEDANIKAVRHPNENLKNSLIVLTILPQIEVAKILADANLLRGLVIYVEKPENS